MELPALQPLCKVCALMNLDPEMWKELHRKVFIEAYSKTKATKWLIQRAEYENANRIKAHLEPLPEYSVHSVMKHFKSHITDFSQVEAFIAAKNMFSPEAKANPAKMMREAVGSDMDDYLRLESLISASAAQLASYENETLSAGANRARNDGLPPPIVNLEEVKVFQKLVQQQMAMKKELAVLQQKQSVAGAAMREAMERVVEVVMNALQDSMVDLGSVLQQNYLSPELINQVTRSVSYMIGEPLKSSIPNILDEVYRRYKIR